MKLLFAVFASLVLAGCAVSGAIVPAATSASGFDGAVYPGKTTSINSPITPTQYRVFNQGSSSFVSLQANLEDAEQRATRYCSQKDLGYRVISETVSKPPHILGNFPRVEIVFECVPKKV